MSRPRKLSRRAFLCVTAGTVTGCATAASAKRVVGANDTVRIGVIGCGTQGSRLLRNLVDRSRTGAGVRVVAVCDIWEKRKRRAGSRSGAEMHHHWQRLVDRNDIDAVVIATPDHWHAPMAIGAMQAGKDIYCERPMTLTVPEAKAFRDAARATGCIVQIGAQQTSEGQWHTARELIAAGGIGRVMWSSCSHGGDCPKGRDSDRDITPQTLDWDAFLGRAPRRPFSPERYLHWRKFWDYSNGIAAELHYHKLASLLVALGDEFPKRVSGAGGLYMQEGRETPDSFVLAAEYPRGHTIVIASAKPIRHDSQTVIRGHKAAIHCEGKDVYVISEKESEQPLGTYYKHPRESRLPVKRMPDHLSDWLDCLRTRKRCACDAGLGYRAMVAVGMSIEAYRTGQAVYWNAEREEVAAGSPSSVQTA